MTSTTSKYAPTEEEMEFAKNSMPIESPAPMLRQRNSKFSPTSEEMEFAMASMPQPVAEINDEAIVDQSQPTAIQELGRNVGRSALRFGESLLGAPGDIANFLGQAAVSGIEKLTGKEQPALRKGAEDARKTIIGTPDLRAKTKEAFGERFEPQSDSEAFADEIITDLPVTPGGIYKKIAVATLGNTAKKAAEQFGLSDEGQTTTKIVTNLLASRVGAKNVKDYYKKQYELAASSVPANAMRNGKRIENYLNLVEQDVKAGGFAPWKQQVLDQISALKNNIKNGAVKVVDINKSLKDIRNQIRNSKNLDPQALRQLKKLERAAKNELVQYGKSNPKFLKYLNNAEAAYAGFAQSKTVSNFIKNKWKAVGLSTGAGLLAEYLIYGPEAPTKTLQGIAVAYGVGKGGELLYRIQANPTLFKYYTGALAGAAAENSQQLTRNLSLLDEGLRKEAQ